LAKRAPSGALFLATKKRSPEAPLCCPIRRGSCGHIQGRLLDPSLDHLIGDPSRVPTPHNLAVLDHRCRWDALDAKAVGHLLPCLFCDRVGHLVGGEELLHLVFGDVAGHLGEAHDVEALVLVLVVGGLFTIMFSSKLKFISLETSTGVPLTTQAAHSLTPYFSHSSPLIIFNS